MTHDEIPQREESLPRQELIARVLRQIRRDLVRELQPELHSPFAQYIAATTATMLDHIIRWLRSGGDNEAGIARARLLEQLGGGQTDDRQMTFDFDDAAQIGGRLAAAVVERIATADDATFNLLVVELAGVEKDMFARETAAMAAEAKAAEQDIGRLEVEITPARLDAYFDATPLFHGRKTEKVIRLPGGYSKDTFLVSTVGGDGPPDLVVRRDFPFGPTEPSVVDEFGPLGRIAAFGLKVPKPLVAERDPAILGQPFMIVERMPGRNPLELFASDPALARSSALELAGLLGRLHAIDPVAAGMLSAIPADPADVIREYVDRWQRHWHRHRLQPSPLIDLAFAWLDRNVPREISRLVIVHGDARQDNTLVLNGRVSAWLDWEFMHVGDPAEELEYTRQYTEQNIDWGEFMAAYHAAGGATVSRAGTRFYEIWRSVRNFVCTDVSWRGFVSGAYPSIKLSAQGVIYRRWFLAEIARSLEKLAE